MKTFFEWLKNENEIAPSSTTPPTYPAQPQQQAQQQLQPSTQPQQQAQMTDAAKDNQAKGFYTKFIDSMQNLPASQWEIYLNHLISAYEGKFRKNFSQVAAVAKGTSSNIQAAQNKLDKQQMNVPVVGGASPSGS